MDPFARLEGVVYTETVIHIPPEQYVADAPYQLAIIDLDERGRVTARILCTGQDERVVIGDRVAFVEERNGVGYYKKISVTAS
jgi:uncharacterized OB-fold protein